ncbi:MAG: HAMP domain-containing sensor histidine kinase [Bacteroidota bacterium]
MSNRLTVFFQRLLRMGIHSNTSFVDAQKTYMFNLFQLFASPFALLSLFFNLTNQAYLPALMNVFQLTVFGIGFYISYRQKWMHIRSFFLLILFAIAAFSAYNYNNGGEYRLQIMMFAAVVLFDKNWQYVLFSLLATTVFILIKVAAMPVDTLSMYELVQNVLKILIPFCIMALSLYYFKHIYFKNLFALELTNQQLVIAKEEKEKILNTVAHDLRSPVSNISGLCHIMLTDEQFSPAQKELVSLVLQASDTSLTLINELMRNNEAGMRRGIRKEISLNELMTKCLSLLEISARKKNIRIDSVLGAGKLMVYIDKHRIERLINNLVNNAIKFSSSGSVIHIETIRENGNAVMVFTDEGIGIPLENHETIFHKDANTRREGTDGEISYGMGLSICKEIIEEHSGTIAMKSEVGKGSSFFVRLPLFHS